MREASGLRSKRLTEDQNRSSSWSWVQFTFAFIIAGATAFLNLRWPLDGLWLHISKTVIIAMACGVLAGRFGDAAWGGIVRIIRWT